MMADIVEIQRTGVPYGLFNQRIEPGFVLKNGFVLLECEKDEAGRYTGGAVIDGMYLRAARQYEPVRNESGEIQAFRRVDRQSVPGQLKTLGKPDQKSSQIRRDINQ